MRKLHIALAAVFAVAGAGAYAGGDLATDMVHDQLAAQRITFPDRETLQKDNPALVGYADEKVDNGEEAKAYSEYINGHLAKVANGKTYSEVSSEYQKNKSDQTLAAQRQSLFMGETLRGLLLSAWGWGLVGAIALYVSYALFFLAFLVFSFAFVASFNVLPIRKKKSSKRRK